MSTLGPYAGTNRIRFEGSFRYWNLSAALSAPPGAKENYSSLRGNIKLALVRGFTAAANRAMHPIMLRRLVPVLLIVAMCLAAPAAWAEAQLSELVIESATGRHAFTVEVADTPEERARGLMFRRTLGANRGMLFDYRHVRPAAMWMKNTILPLDILFIAADGRVVNIAQYTVPGSLDTIPSHGPVRAVLEINAGTVARLGIAPDDRVVHRIFGGAGD